MLCTFVGFTLTGCVTNTQSSQTAQLASVASVAPARAPVQNQQPTMTPGAKLANAKTIEVSKTTTAGATLILASPQALARDCSSLGRVETKIVNPPEHGTIAIAPGTAFSNFTPGDPPYLCNAKKSPATLITYKPAPGFSGQDIASVQLFFPDGLAPTIIFRIDVR